MIFSVIFWWSSNLGIWSPFIIFSGTYKQYIHVGRKLIYVPGSILLDDAWGVQRGGLVWVDRDYHGPYVSLKEVRNQISDQKDQCYTIKKFVFFNYEFNIWIIKICGVSIFMNFNLSTNFNIPINELLVVFIQKTY